MNQYQERLIYTQYVVIGCILHPKWWVHASTLLKLLQKFRPTACYRPCYPSCCNHNPHCLGAVSLVVILPFIALLHLLQLGHRLLLVLAALPFEASSVGTLFLLSNDPQNQRSLPVPDAEAPRASTACRCPCRSLRCDPDHSEALPRPHPPLRCSPPAPGAPSA